MPSVIGNCAFCPNENIELINSHIIPEFCYRRLYTAKHQIKAAALLPENDLVMEQKGYREFLLCHDCECLFSQWENSFRWFMEDIITESQRKITITKMDSLEIVEGFNYEHIKRAILSIIWRASVSSLEPFKEYKLGPYEIKLKRLLRSNNGIDTRKYPVMIN